MKLCLTLLWLMWKRWRTRIIQLYIHGQMEVFIFEWGFVFYLVHIVLFTWKIS